jgi:hypothetical protein
MRMAVSTNAQRRSIAQRQAAHTISAKPQAASKANYVGKDVSGRAFSIAKRVAKNKVLDA